MTSANKKPRNGYIELLRFLFCMIIVFHHSGFLLPAEKQPFPLGGMVADGFFLIIGFFAMRHCESVTETGHEMAHSIKYTFEKVKKLFPYALVGTTLIYLRDFAHLFKGTASDSVLYIVQDYLYEVFFLPMSGLMYVDDVSKLRNAPMWFVSAMMLSLPLVMYLALRFKDVFKNYLVWILPAIIYGTECYYIGGIINWETRFFCVYSGLVRGFCDICIGCLLYILSCKLKSLNFKTVSKTLLTVCELLLMAFSVYMMVLNYSFYNQIFMLLVLALSLLLSLSEVTFTSKLHGRFFEELGFLSMPIFTLHWPIYWYVQRYCSFLNPYLGILLVIAISIVLTYLIKFVLSKILKPRA